MKVLIVARCKKGNYAPFITEQVSAIEKQGVECRFLGVEGGGIFGYIRHIPKLLRAIQDFHPDIIHAHYGLCGLLANIQRQIPVVTTYHGSDINDTKIRSLSLFSMHLSAWNVFVSQRILDKAKPQKHFALLPCGIDLCEAQKTEKSKARQMMGLSNNHKYVLFSGAFDNEVKNAFLAKESVSLVRDQVELLELKGYSREEVILLMCSADAFLMTSFSEGSPQVIKEALACGCPIVSVDVGDVKERLSRIDGCYVAKTYNKEELACLLHKAISFENKTKGRDRVVSDGLDNSLIAETLIEYYTNILNNESI